LLGEAVARLRRGRRCLLTEAEVWSYGDLLDRANQIARVLTEEFGLALARRACTSRWRTFNATAR
jgi:2-aminobenzoate-CoA ligase